jgi:hypothetical protein
MISASLKTIAAWACAAMLVILATAIGTSTPAAAQERFGSVAGIVKDSSGAILPGVTVTVTNKVTQRVYTAVSGGDGSYRILDLEPGRYTVRFELSGFATADMADVNILLGKSLDVSPSMKVGGVTEAITVTTESPLIDTKSTTIAHNVTAEEFDRIPKGRTFQNLAISSPSVNAGDIEGGIQVNGASGAENAFTVDGVVTNSLIDGRSRQDAVFEYLQEVQVKTGGISAEYGGALGGVVSAVTKSGGNSFHGEGHYYFGGSSLSASPVRRLVLDTSDDQTVRYFQDPKQDAAVHDIGGSIGGPIVKNKLFFFTSLSPRYVRRTNDYQFNNGTDPGSIDQKQTYMSAFAKVNYDPTSRLHTSFSFLTTPTKSTGFLPAYDASGQTWLTSTKDSNLVNRDRGFDQPQKSYSGTLDYTVTNSSLISVRAGMFDDNYKDTGVPAISSVVYQTSNIGLGYPVSPDQVGGVNFQNTPRVQVSNFDHTKRGYVNLDYTQTMSLGGIHNFKAGFGVQHSSNDVDYSYPGGGWVYVWWDRAFTSNATGITDRGPYGYYEVNNRGTIGKTSGNIYSLYFQDEWSMRKLTLNLGLRTEKEIIPSFRPDIRDYAIKFGFGDKLAPRIGASYDWFGDGRLKVYGSWGRYFDWTKYELSRGSFGGDVWQIYYRSLDTTDAFSLSGTNMPGRNLWNGEANSFRDRRVPNFNSTDPNLKPMSQDSMNVGTEYQLNSQTVLTVNYSHNNLRRTIEDLGVIENGDEVYKYVNPGEGIATTMVPSGLTPTFATPKPKRQYDAIELSLTRRFANNWFGSASYVYSRLYGNYAGLANSDEIRTPTTLTSSATSQQQAGSIARPGSSAHRGWDLDEVVWDAHGNLNVLGRLATDRPHVVKLYGSYMLPFGTQLGAFFYGGSGTPVTRTVWTLNQIPVMVDGRGSMGRTPVLTQTDLLLSHDLKIGGDKRMRFEMNVLNLFNQKTARHIFDQVNRPQRQSAAIDLSHTDLSKGFDYNALLAANADGAAKSADPRYGMNDLFNPGTQARVSVKFIF